MTKPAHRPDGGTWAQTCVCGGEIVYFEDVPTPGYGCDTLAGPTRAFETVR